MPRQEILIGLIIPAISVTGVFLRGTETMERRPIDWRVLGGGIVFGAVVVVLGASGVLFAQEIIFIVSMAVVCYMLVLVTAELDRQHEEASCSPGSSCSPFAPRRPRRRLLWWTLDELNFDAAFYGTLRQIGAILVDRRDVDVQPAIDRIVRNQGCSGLRWRAVLSLPNIALIYGVQHWTKECSVSAPAPSPSSMPLHPRRLRSSAWCRYLL